MAKIQTEYEKTAAFIKTMRRKIAEAKQRRQKVGVNLTSEGARILDVSIWLIERKYKDKKQMKLIL